MKTLSISTSLVASLGVVIMLKMLSYFHFIKWNPVGFSHTFEMFSKSNVSVKWGVLFLFTWAVCIALYYISILFVKVPVSITSLVLGLLIAFVLEWIILDANSIEKTFKKLSIPFICIVLIFVRFLMESAIFHAQDSPLSK